MPDLPRILVCGGRHYRNVERVWSALDAVLDHRGPFVLVHGACRTGADYHAHRWAQSRGVTEEPHPADWQVHGDAAGPIRNREMVQSGLHGAVVFEGGRGTADMVRRLEEAGVSIWRPDEMQRLKKGA